MALDFLLQRVKDAIYDDPNNPYQRGDNHGLMGQIDNIFGDFGRNSGGMLGGLFGGGQQTPRPGSIDNPLPASQDPYGDPADQEGHIGRQGNDLRSQFPNLRPASQDPYGDPADQELRR